TRRSALAACAARKRRQVARATTPMNYQTTYASRRPAVRPLAAFAILASALLPLSAQTPAPSTVAATTNAAKDEPITMDAFVSTGTRFNNRTVTESPVPIDV